MQQMLRWASKNMGTRHTSSLQLSAGQIREFRKPADDWWTPCSSPPDKPEGPLMISVAQMGVGGGREDAAEIKREKLRDNHINNALLWVICWFSNRS
jgi:hypothetical protein